MHHTVLIPLYLFVFTGIEALQQCSLSAVTNLTRLQLIFETLKLHKSPSVTTCILSVAWITCNEQTHRRLPPISEGPVSSSAQFNIFQLIVMVLWLQLLVFRFSLAALVSFICSRRLFFSEKAEINPFYNVILCLLEL